MSVMTPIGKLIFANALFEAKTNKENPAQGPRHNIMLAFDELGVKSSAYQELRKAVMEAITEKWGGAKANDANFVRSLRLPFRPASEKTYGGLEGMSVFIAPWCKPEHAPEVVDLHGTKIAVPGDVWAGQLARATVRAFAYDSNGNKGVAFYLEHVQIVKADMPRVDGKQSAAQAFTAPADDEQLKALGIDMNAPASGGGGSTSAFPF